MNLLKKPCRLVRERPGLSLSLEVPHPRQPDPDPDPHPHPAVLFPLLLSAIPKCSPTEALSRRILPLCLARAVPFPSVMAKARPREGALRTRLPVLPKPTLAHATASRGLRALAFTPPPHPPKQRLARGFACRWPSVTQSPSEQGEERTNKQLPGKNNCPVFRRHLASLGPVLCIHTHTHAHTPITWFFFFFFLSDLGSHVLCKSPRSPT